MRGGTLTKAWTYSDRRRPELCTALNLVLSSYAPVLLVGGADQIRLDNDTAVDLTLDQRQLTKIPVPAT